MPSRFDRILTRAAKLPGSGAGLGNSAPGTGYSGNGNRPRADGMPYGRANNSGKSRGKSKAPIAGTTSITYNSPGQPQNMDIANDMLAAENYQSSVYVMRCVRLIAETLAASPFVAGMDPFNPGDFSLDAPLSRLLGPSTPQAPGGPNPHASARAFWIWTVCQYIVTGRFCWEKLWDGTPGRSNIDSLWCLPSAAVSPIPIDGKVAIWSGFQYQTPTGFKQLGVENVLYAWRMGFDDWRMPESVLSSAALPIYMQRAVDTYMTNLLKNNMVATTMIIAPPFDESDQRRSWEDQFQSEFTGVDRAGGTIFGYAEADEDDPAGKPLVQVERLAQTPMEASLFQLSNAAKSDITISLGVPKSLLGDASQRVFANSNAEYRNFWTITMLNIISEMEDHVNLRLAPQIGQEVGWFDLSKVEALQPPSIFMPPDIAEAINMNILNAEQAAQILGIPPLGSHGDSDVDTVMVGEEAAAPNPSGYQRSVCRLGLMDRVAFVCRGRH